ncbi:MAG: hypothetical protein NZM25_02960 [Leptospiraceae bacterium]|nr:hypothetical protein [Leptospiraceae bacterium]MDW8307229.1 hypothetical protein [Leptospiraceae bacterium]
MPNQEANGEGDQPKPQILVHPKTIYWVDMPDVLLPHDRIELLKHDVMIKSVISEKLSTLPRDPEAGYVFNLDRYIQKNRTGKLPSEIALAQRLLGIIQSNLVPARSLVHTTYIDPSLQQMYRQAGVLLLEKNIDSKKNIVPLVGKFVEYLFRNDARLKRDFVRIKIPAEWKSPIRITNLRTSVPGIRGVVMDISLNGVGVRFDKAESIGLFQLKDPARLDFYIEERHFVITLAFVARLHTATQEGGFIFNIRNPNMISDEHATNYSSMIYEFLKSVA